MLRIKTIILAAVFSIYAALPILAKVNTIEEQESFTYCTNENQKVDISDWIIFPISFEYIVGQFSKKENVEISFPESPKFVEENGVQPSHFTATDRDGMTFNIASLRITEENFNLRKSVDFIAESIAKSPNKKLFAVAYPEPNPNDSGYGIMWTEGDKMISLTFIKSFHFIYFLETNIHDEIYRDTSSIEMGSESFDKMIRNSLKNGAFVKSFVIISKVKN